LTTSEQRRLIVLNHLESGALVNAEAARLLDLSVRQLQRIKAAYSASGAAALSHGNRGRGPVHALDPELALQGGRVGHHDLCRISRPLRPRPPPHDSRPLPTTPGDEAVVASR
jgi:Winged helix-turn helix